jgi:rod shape-determining protein MreD
VTPIGTLIVVVRSSLVIFVALVLQIGLLANLPVFEARADIMMLIGIAAGLAAGPDRGAAYGFAAGMAYDLLLHTPLGLSALVYSIVGYLAGLGRDAMLRAVWWVPVGTAAAASAAGVILYVVFGRVVGQSAAGLPVLNIVLVVSVVNALLAPLAVRTMRWASGSGALGRARPVMR